MTSAWALTIASEIDRAPPYVDGLTPGQCRLLAALQAAKGRALRADTLGGIAAANPADGGGANLAKVQVYHIRQRRPDLGAQIETVTGFGYRWVAR